MCAPKPWSESAAARVFKGLGICTELVSIEATCLPVPGLGFAFPAFAGPG